jgi:hypothetical protein
MTPPPAFPMIVSEADPDETLWERPIFELP